MSFPPVLSASKETVSMSGLQTDFYSDYIGGEIRLAYWHDGEKILPLTGISISGKLTDVLNNILFSGEAALQGSCFGPKKAIVTGMHIFRFVGFGTARRSFPTWIYCDKVTGAAAAAPVLLLRCLTESDIIISNKEFIPEKEYRYESDRAETENGSGKLHLR